MIARFEVPEQDTYEYVNRITEYIRDEDEEYGEDAPLELFVKKIAGYVDSFFVESELEYLITFGEIYTHICREVRDVIAAIHLDYLIITVRDHGFNYLLEKIMHDDLSSMLEVRTEHVYDLLGDHVVRLLETDARERYVVKELYNYILDTLKDEEYEDDLCGFLIPMIKNILKYEKFQFSDYKGSKVIDGEISLFIRKRNERHKNTTRRSRRLPRSPRKLLR